MPDAPAMDAPTLFVVAHTHWDREWYHPAARFRQRLVALVDALLAAPPDPARPFLLDGQAIVLADYLAVRPGAAPALAAHLKAGALEAGPWFVLADTLLPGGEALIRNLEAGRRWLWRFGGAPPPVAYSPDAFGHPDALPTLATGFGLPVAVVWRGVGDGVRPGSDAWRWRSSGGDKLLACHLPPDGYEFGSALPTDPLEAAHRWARLRAVLAPRAATPAWLLTAGADHHAAPPALDAAIAALAEAAAADGIAVRRASLTGWAEAAQAACAGRSLPHLVGEQRDSRGHAWSLQGTFATRAHQKRRNARLERALAHDVEPWEALAWLHATPSWRAVAPDARLTLAQSPALLGHAWETLLRTHPHDTLCGCSVDAVARAMDARQRDVAAMVPGLRRALLEAALGHDPVAARGRRPLAEGPVVVRNRAARPRGGIARLRIEETLADVPVGPGSGAQPIPPVPAVPTVPLGSAVPEDGASAGARPAVLVGVVQRLRSRLAHRRRESPQHYPDDDLVRVHEVLAWVPEVPAHGVRVLAPDARAAAPPTGVPADAPPAPAMLARQRDALVLDNGRVRIVAAPGGVTIEAHGRRLDDCLAFDSTTDAGDSYTPSLRGDPVPLALVRVRPRAGGPLRAAVALRWVLPAGRGPAVATDLASMTDAPAAGDARRGPVCVDAVLTLDAGAAHVGLALRVVNRRRDHRLRLLWRSGVAATRVLADAALGPVWRAVAAGDDADHGLRPLDPPAEIRLPTMPLHRWIAAFDGDRGATLVSDGLAEAEPLPHGMAVTLVRAVGELSRRDLPERPGHAGWPARIPRAQCLGTWRAAFGLLVHGGDAPATRERIEAVADDLLLPLVGETWCDYAGPVQSLAGVALEGTTLRASSVARALTADALRLRAVNVSETPADGAWRLPDDGPWESAPCRLDETPLAPWTRHGARLPLTVPSRATVTHLVRRAER